MIRDTLTQHKTILRTDRYKVPSQTFDKIVTCGSRPEVRAENPFWHLVCVLVDPTNAKVTTMNLLNHERISELAKYRSPVCLSLFMPTHRTGREQRQDAIRLKNLINDAEEKLRGKANAATVDTVLKPIVDLRRNREFLQHCSDGLACFSSPEFFRAYRVPIQLDEQLFLNKRFYIRPLLPLLRTDARVYILALTQESAKLFEATQFSLREVDLPEIPRLETKDEGRNVQYHSHKSPAQGKGARDTAIYHGHGDPGDRAKKEALRFFQLVDSAVKRVLHGQRSPLVLACVGYLASLYQLANSYRHLSKGKVPGSPDRWSEDELREHAWTIIEPHVDESRKKAWRAFQEAREKGRASDELRSVVLGAELGRVDKLFLSRDDERWGYVEPPSSVRQVDTPHEGEELLDYAAVRTLNNGGDVYLFDALPSTDSPIAATFRY